MVKAVPENIFWKIQSFTAGGEGVQGSSHGNSLTLFVYMGGFEAF